MPIPPKTLPIRQVRPAAAPPAPAPLSAAATPVGEASTDLLTPAAVARRLSVNTKMLERWRGTGAGPAVVRITHKTLRYRLEDVEAFIASRVRTSTAQ